MIKNHDQHSYSHAITCVVLVSTHALYLMSSCRYAKYRDTLLSTLTMLRSIDFHPVKDASRPQSVEAITARKLASGHISAAERAHILKVQRLLKALEESSDLLASSDEEGDTGGDDEDEEEDEEEEAGTDHKNESTNAQDVGSRPFSPGSHNAYPDMSKVDSLNVFAKVRAKQTEVGL